MSDSGAALWKLALVESDLVPANYSSIVPRTYYLIPDIPMGRQAGLRWITESLRVSIDRGNTSSVPFWGDMFEPGAKNGRHLLVEALEVREEVRGRLLRWDSDESFQFDVDSLENLDWPGIQATRCRDARYPLPHFSGVEVQMRRVHVSRLLRECIAALEDAESELILSSDSSPVFPSSSTLTSTHLEDYRTLNIVDQPQRNRLPRQLTFYLVDYRVTGDTILTIADYLVNFSPNLVAGFNLTELEEATYEVNKRT
ncbi:hypothetical protein K435DRAFT_861197 [Dendrothele bispora CBS 962.96]|uniref:Uncharacterized protein n=1 Tax=Dendrothele bispora (strain CBS 962.96) TaxID=1314807 RepID=A0A4S8LVW5_DENBC|nr:hypothetical protein K435DRAFT_861197 [Dendrothele bispora CBS 962.96]